MEGLKIMWLCKLGWHKWERSIRYRPYVKGLSEIVGFNRYCIRCEKLEIKIIRGKWKEIAR